MKKIKKTTESNIDKLSALEEPAVFYGKLRTVPALKEFTYNDFKKVADKVPFTMAEWAEILHISQRTLQRYAKDNHAFASINSERFQQITALCKRGTEVFGDINKFYRWLKSEPYMLEGKLSIQSLHSYEGISMVLIQLGRIEHGIFA